MEHINRLKEDNLVKKNMDFLDVKKKTKEFLVQMKEKKYNKRAMITETQSHNKNEFNLKINQKRNSVDADRLESQKIARDNLEKAAFIEQLEREEAFRKKNQHKKELE